MPAVGGEGTRSRVEGAARGPLLDLGPGPWIVGHRGAAGEALENTLEAVLHARTLGLPLIEIDVQRCRDGELVVFHDRDLRRLAGRSGLVEGLSWSELEAVTLRDRARGFTGRLVRLETLLDRLAAEQPLNVELKRYEAPAAELAAAAVALLRGHRGVLLSSFDWGLLELCRSRWDGPLAPIAESAAGVAEAADRLEAWSVHLAHRASGPRLVSALRRAGRRVLTFTVDDPAEARRLGGLGVDGVFTDHPSRHLEATLRAGTERPSSRG